MRAKAARADAPDGGAADVTVTRVLAAEREGAGDANATVSAVTLEERVLAAERDGGDAVGLAFVRSLIEQADVLPASGRARLLARAELLIERYRVAAPAQERARAVDRDAWRAALEVRASERPPRAPSEARCTTVLAELRATAATTRAADQVPEAAGPYNGAVVASRALAELASLSPAYLGGYVAWLADLACLAELPERRTTRRKGSPQ